MGGVDNWFHKNYGEVKKAIPKESEPVLPNTGKTTPTLPKGFGASGYETICERLEVMIELQKIIIQQNDEILAELRK